MKKLIIITIAGGIMAMSFSSCSSGYTCPTYAKKDVSTLDKKNNQEI